VGRSIHQRILGIGREIMIIMRVSFTLIENSAMLIGGALGRFQIGDEIEKRDR
jgi:hypothetical protein